MGVAARVWPSDAPAWGLLIFPAGPWLPRLSPIFSSAGRPFRCSGSLPIALLGEWPPSISSLTALTAALAVVAAALIFGASSYGINLKRQKSWPSLRVVAEARAFMAPECMAVVIIAARGAHFEHDE